MIRAVSSVDSRVAIVGVGVSLLVADLLTHGYRSIDAVDISGDALSRLRKQLGDRALAVRFIQADVRALELAQPVEVWHDRATFHFLTDPADRATYASRAAAAIVSGGHLIVATFALDGPAQCSDLPVQRHDAPSLAREFKEHFTLVDHAEHLHVTPWGSEQRFIYATLRRTEES